MSHRPTRGGAALIIAIILLAALVMLGLPFLYSQSTSLAGTRSFAHQQQAISRREAAERIAIGIAGEVIRPHFQAGTGTVASTSFATNGPTIQVGSPPVTKSLLVSLIAPDLKWFAVDLESLGYPRKASPMSATIVDEQGKVDVNHLGPAGWTNLLEKLSIQDWDDSHFWDSEDFTGPDGSLTDGEDSDEHGELAEALANLRFRLPGQRITALEQLLDADPGENTDAVIPANAYGGPGSSPPGSFGFRRRLTRAELEVLRPYLSVHLRGQGRGTIPGSRATGLIDLGTSIAQVGNRTFIDSNWLNSVPQSVGQKTLEPTIGPGTVIAWHDANDADEPVKFAPVVAGTPSDGLALRSAPSPYDYTFVAGQALGIQAAPAVNLFHTTLPVLAALGPKLTPSNSGGATTYGGLLLGSDQHPFHYLNPLESGYERPTVDIASFGIVQIMAAAGANDPLGRQAAQQRRQIVAQAVPQESVLERRWTTQGEWHALLSTRAGSLVETWPKPIRRVRDLAPDESPASAPTVGPVGIRPAVMPNLATGFENRALTRKPTHGNWDWQLPFGLGAAETTATVFFPMIDTIQSTTLFSLGADPAQLHPDGYDLAGKPLPLPLKPEVNPATDWGILRGVSNDIHDLRARHLSFWITPTADFEDSTIPDKVYPLFETRIKTADAGQRLDDSIGSGELENHLALYYDRKRQLLALILAPPAIEHVADRGPLIQPDDAATNADVMTRTWAIDERSLGDNTGMPLAPRQPGPPSPLAETGSPFAAISSLYKANRIVHLYGLPDQDGRPYFRKERACHIQVIIAGDRPGMFRVIVDGIVGKDVSRTLASALTLGDHLTLPALALVSSKLAATTSTKIPMVDVSTGGGAVLGPMEITVQGPLGLTAASLFPARGMLRIDDEYFSYESVSGNIFKGCVRGQRQYTQVNRSMIDPTDPSKRIPDKQYWWPNTQEHLAGAMVIPGGYRLNLTAGKLYRGGSTLVDELPNGDPQLSLGTQPVNPYRWSIWTRLNTTALEKDLADPTGLRYWWRASATTIPIMPAGGADTGVEDQFPPSGIVRFRGLILHYGKKTSTSLDEITDITPASGFTPYPTRPATGSPGAFPVKADVDAYSDQITPIKLLSIELSNDPSADPIQDGRYNLTWTGNRYGNGPWIGDPVEPLLLQLRHPITGRVEWIGYYHILAKGQRRYLVNHHDGWQAPFSRGQQRTACAATVPALIGQAFPGLNPGPATLAIPVQTELGGPGHYVATGDVVTLMPKIRQGGQRAQQLLVRYAAMDGYDAAGGNGGNDTKNQYFAFDGPLPDISRIPANGPGVTIAATNYELLCWPCWSARDLTPLDPIGSLEAPAGHLPRIDLLSDFSLASLDKAKLSADLASQPALSATDVTNYLKARQEVLPAVVDGIAAGGFTGMLDPRIPNGITLTTASAAPTIAVAATDKTIQTTHAIFPSNQPMGLVVIDGETFAYRRVDDDKAVLVGRGLLDLVGPLGVSHDIAAGPVVPIPTGAQAIRSLLNAYVLPIGPVAELNGTPGPVGTWFDFVTDTAAASPGVELDAPSVLLCDPTGDPLKVELLTPIGPHQFPGPTGRLQYTTAPWLRGQYNTISFTAAGSGTIAIGWWPRYASALPKLPTPEQMRSRSFAWVGMPFALAGARFDSATVGMESALVTLADVDHPLAFSFSARASAHGLLWANTSIGLNSGTYTPQDLSAAFTGSDFSTPVEGAELRLTWHYEAPPSSSLLAIAEASGRAPMISEARLRAVAPTTILAVEGAR